MLQKNLVFGSCVLCIYKLAVGQVCFNHSKFQYTLSKLDINHPVHVIGLLEELWIVLKGSCIFEIEIMEYYLEAFIFYQ